MLCILTELCKNFIEQKKNESPHRRITEKHMTNNIEKLKHLAFDFLNKKNKQSMRFSYFYQIFIYSKFWQRLREHLKFKKKKINETNTDSINNANEVFNNCYGKTQYKPRVGLVKDHLGHHAYWPKYERYLKKNDLPYEFLDIDLSNWLQKANLYDIIVWHTSSDPATQAIAKSKIYILEKVLNKICIPSYNEIWFYEDKINQYYLLKAHNFPIVNSFISNSKEEALKFISDTKYPLVSKIRTGSGAQGVELVKNFREAKKIVDNSFGRGRLTYWTYERQKDYVYFQDFIEDSKYDLRVIVIGNKYFGYYRLPSQHDFRASGSGIVVKEKIPHEALRLVRDIKLKLGTKSMIAVDMMKSESSNEFKIIEISTFIGIITCEQLKADGKPGYYLNENDNFKFMEGKFWIQELALNEIVNSWYDEKRKFGTRHQSP